MTEQIGNCKCLTWAWVDLPYANRGSKHHPNCKHYKGEPFKRIECDGSFCIVEPREVGAFLTGEDADDCVVTEVVMTREEFEALPEFEGF